MTLMQSAAARTKPEPRLRIHYMDDSGPLGVNVYPASEYPRAYDTYDLGHVGSITLPKSMTPKEWDFLFQWLELTRSVGRVVDSLDEVVPVSPVSPAERDAQPVADATGVSTGAAS
jgi:hypothetical protein